jgi:hypothetical protein
MVRRLTMLTTTASRRSRSESCDTVVRGRRPVQEHQSTLRAYNVGRAEPSVRRRAPAAAGSDVDAVVKVLLNDVRAR